MSFVPNFQPEGYNLNGGYWSTYDGNSFGNTDRKRSRNNYNHVNYNVYNDNQTKYGHHGGNFNFCNEDHTNYVKSDSVPSSLKKRKYSAPVWEESQKYNLPSIIFQVHPIRFNADTSTSTNSKPDFSIFDDDEPVFMSRDDIDRYSPSRKDGIDIRRETHLRYSYCAFLQNLGTRLEL